MSLLLVPFLKRSLTEDLDRKDNVDNAIPRLGYIKLLRHKRIFYAGVNQTINVFVFTVGQPLFGPRLEDAYGLSDFVIGVMFAIPAVSYIITGTILFPLIAKKFEPRTSMIFGFIVLGMTCFMLGPSNLLGFPDKSLTLMIMGLAVLGVGAAFTIIPIIPEMLDTVDGKYPDYTGEISDNFSAIFNCAGGLGQIVGPSVSGLLKNQLGFAWTFDIVALIVFGHLLAYILICGGFASIARSFKATVLRCKRSSTQETLDEITNSPESPIKKRLLEDSDEEDSSAIKDSYNMSLDSGDTTTETDISSGNQNHGYAINQD
jgi:MFS family permease